MSGEITYRPAVAADAQATYDVFVTATNDLNRRSGRPQVAGAGPSDRALAFRHHAIRHDGERFWVAEAAGRVVGFAIGTLRADVWYLAALHVLPDHQGHHVGSTLIRHSLAGTTPSTVLTVYTDAINPDSNGLYMTFGMLAQEAILAYEGPIDAPRRQWSAVERAHRTAVSDRRLEPRPISMGTDAVALEDIDSTTLGAPRAIDHELWSQADNACGLLLLRDGRPSGYLYVTTTGSIGPIAVRSPADVGPALDIAADVADAAGAGRLYLRVPSSCRDAGRWALDRGLRLAGVGLMLSSSPVGRFDRYLISTSDALL